VVILAARNLKNMVDSTSLSTFLLVVIVISQTVTGGGGGAKKKPAAGAKGKKPAASNAEKEEPVEKELPVSATVSKLGMYLITIFHVQPGTDLAGCMNSDSSEAGVRFENRHKTSTLLL